MFKGNNQEELVLSLARSFFSALKGSEYADRQLGYFNSNDTNAIMDAQFPELSGSVSTFKVDYASYSFLRKFPFKGRDRKAVALASFFRSEEHCRSMNSAFLEAYCSRDKEFVERLELLRHEVRRILRTPFCWNEASSGFAWGPGATSRLGSSMGDPYYKFRGNPESTLYNLPAATAAISTIPLWCKSVEEIKIVPGGKLTTVPKDGKTDRTICIEPCMNMYIQKGIGAMIRKRLRRFGCDLNDQTVNQDFARRAYSEGFSTLDLSAASDSVSSVLVDLIFPDDWLSALKRCRSPRFVYDSKVRTFEKFSTMGNGYTFELESLIFLAIVRCAADQNRVGVDISVYGDDIICRQGDTRSVIEWLSYFGFTVNLSKSFFKGPFFESCGKHYFKGVDVTPVFLKTGIHTPLDENNLINSIARWGGSNIQAGSCEAYRRVCSHFDLSTRSPIPDGVGNGGLIVVSNFDVNRNYKPPRKLGSQSLDYQHGYDYVALCDVFIPFVDRQATDVPYLLRHLYYLDRRSSSTSEQSYVFGQRKLKYVQSWSDSWAYTTLG